MTTQHDLGSDLAKVAAATGRKAADIGRDGLTLRITSEQIGLATAALVTFLGIGLIGPGLAKLRAPRRRSLRARAQTSAQRARKDAALAGYRIRDNLYRAKRDTFGT